MNIPCVAALIVSVIAFLSKPWVFPSAESHNDFVRCLQSHNSSSSISSVVYTPTHSSFLPIFEFAINNQRLETPDMRKPVAIVTPTHESHVQASIYCARLHDLQVRVRSGGHDYEGLSYVAQVPFVMIDLINHRSISIDDDNNTAWVQAGATLGELYHTIAGRTNTRGFVGGNCPSVGVGGHFSGGGYGMMSRKYGVAADHIVDAKIVDVNGRILDRESMGEDLFWAIRGGGAASFGVVLAWKIELLPVPERVTVFTVKRTNEQDAMRLFQRWQHVASKMDENLLIRLFLRFASLIEGKRTPVTYFRGLFLGSPNDLLSSMQRDFPELGVVKEDCVQMRWIESVLYFADFPRGEPLEALLNRSYMELSSKAKSDFVTVPLPEDGIKGIWEWFAESQGVDGELLLSPFGGKLDEIPESSIPFPHRSGNLYSIHYALGWLEEGREVTERNNFWLRRIHNYMTPFVSKSPRAAYFNYKDFDLGVNRINGNTSYAEASIWGIPYYKGNFRRLVQVKTMVDPANFFRNGQSIPIDPSLIIEARRDE